uniref:Uncharacterized protein n=1 Tax=Anguilla anguilla TaxID=7936 RepID=A0A0E9UXU8_ANGAN
MTPSRLPDLLIWNTKLDTDKAQLCMLFPVS